MAIEQRKTYCRICESLCGLVATVEDGRITKLRPNAEHSISQGFACPKGIAMKDVVNDPDRVLYPLRRKPGAARGEGGIEQFERVSWDEALDDIGRRLEQTIARHGGHSVGAYLGNPVYFSYSPPMWLKGFIDALGSPHFYTPGSQDTASRSAASAFLYGSTLQRAWPDRRSSRRRADRRRGGQRRGAAGVSGRTHGGNRHRSVRLAYCCDP
jgi:anaerobic selenocysteine-containing dehydrogenase